jgi:hypothetical protein
VRVKGSGFYDGNFVLLLNEYLGTMSTEYDVTPSSTSPHSALSFVTTGQLPGPDLTLLCSVSGCSGDQEVCLGGECMVNVGGGSSPTFLTFYPPGAPRLTGATPKRGTAGTFVTLSGVNISQPEEVWLGTHKLRSGYFGTTETESGAMVTAFVVPRGLKVGKSYDIRVATAESEATQKNPESPVNPHVTFTLTHPLKRR